MSTLISVWFFGCMALSLILLFAICKSACEQGRPKNRHTHRLAKWLAFHRTLK